MFAGAIYNILKNQHRDDNRWRHQIVAQFP